MVIDLRPVTQQLDTLESTDVLSPEFLSYAELKLEFIRYVTGEIDKPHYQVPAIVQCSWCGSEYDICEYNGTGEWCPSMCFDTI